MTRRTTTIIIIIAIGTGIFILALLGIVILVNPVSISTGPRVAVIEIIGPIQRSEAIIEQIHRYKDNPSIKAILLRIDSPGGSVAPVQEIHAELEKVENKQIIASMGGTAASGGYYIACAADEIFANPGTLTGSIGVIMQIITVNGLLKKVGVDSAVIKSGKFKDTGSPMRAMTEEEKSILQETIDDVQSQFVEAVLKGRQHLGLTQEQIVELADGRIFSGQQALNHKLIDKLGGLQDAIKRAGELGGIKGKPKIIRERRRRSLLERMLGVSPQQQIDKWLTDGVSLKYELHWDISTAQ